ncbi:MAG: hypothetical protein PWP52_390 [Bacteroidales bacterium]|nr:hypothetical protein [Bacteroidales bacterium]
MIKKIIILLLNVFNKSLFLFNKNIVAPKTHFKFFWCHVNNNNLINLENCFVDRTKIYIDGFENKFFARESFLFNTKITIDGKGNTIEIKKGVKLRNGLIQIRGSNCKIIINEGTSFGQIRMVNVGKNNNIVIGKNNLFADDIEIWASDTHSIFDENNNFINQEKPVFIGDYVWVGNHVRILKGVTIGNGAIIGMNSVVTKSILPKTLNVGVPTKIIRENVTWDINY